MSKKFNSKTAFKKVLTLGVFRSFSMDTVMSPIKVNVNVIETRVRIRTLIYYHTRGRLVLLLRFF